MSIVNPAGAKMLRAYFRYDRRLLGDLCRVAAGAITQSFRVLLDEPDSEPGLVVCVHSFGNLPNFHPHLHVMATDGAFTPEGLFHPLPALSLDSSVQRGRRRRQGREKMPLGPVPLYGDAPYAKAARASWARFIKKVFAADPLECPDCGGAMRIVAFIENRRVVRAILEHLSLWDEPRPPPVLPAAARAPLELEYLPWVE